MMTVEWFGVQIQASWIAVVEVIAVTFLLCAGVALAVGKIARMRVGAITTALGGGAILFAVVMAGGVWFAYSALSSSQ
jgi:hypothetical protein